MSFHPAIFEENISSEESEEIESDDFSPETMTSLIRHFNPRISESALTNLINEDNLINSNNSNNFGAGEETDEDLWTPQQVDSDEEIDSLIKRFSPKLAKIEYDRKKFYIQLRFSRFHDNVLSVNTRINFINKFHDLFIKTEIKKFPPNLYEVSNICSFYSNKTSYYCINTIIYEFVAQLYEFDNYRKIIKSLDQNNNIWSVYITNMKLFLQQTGKVVNFKQICGGDSFIYGQALW
jgi:hypothetical protein